MCPSQKRLRACKQALPSLQSSIYRIFSWEHRFQYQGVWETGTFHISYFSLYVSKVFAQGTAGVKSKLSKLGRVLWLCSLLWVPCKGLERAAELRQATYFYSAYRIYSEMDLISSFISQKKIMSIFSARHPTFHPGFQRGTQQILVNNLPACIMVFLSFAGASVHFVLISGQYLSLHNTRPTPKKRKKKKIDQAWSNYWKSKTDFAVLQHICSTEQPLMFQRCCFYVILYPVVSSTGFSKWVNYMV